MSLNCASGINTKYWLLALSSLAGKTLCPVLLPASSSGLHLRWVPQYGTIFFSEAEDSRHSLLPPSLCPLHPAHWRDTFQTQSLGDVRPTSLRSLFLPHLSPSARYTPALQTPWVFPPPGENPPLPILPNLTSNCVPIWKESSARAGFLLISA